MVHFLVSIINECYYDAYIRGRKQKCSKALPRFLDSALDYFRLHVHTVLSWHAIIISWISGFDNKLTGGLQQKKCWKSEENAEPTNYKEGQSIATSLSNAVAYNCSTLDLRISSFMMPGAKYRGLQVHSWGTPNRVWVGNQNLNF